MTESIPNALCPKASAALTYLSHGFALVPLGDETGNRSKKSHGILGSGWSFRRGGSVPFVGMVDPEHAIRWWSSRPQSNIGIITGIDSQLLVIDCDQHEKPSTLPDAAVQVRWGEMLSTSDGVVSFTAWAEEHDVDLSSVPRARTATGNGVHYFFHLREDLPTRNGWLPGVDAKAGGGFVVAAPSVVAGVSYRWEVPLDDLPDVPDVILAALQAPRVSTASVDYSGRSDDDPLPSTDWFLKHGFRPGRRNQDCYRLAFRLWSHHWPHDDIVRSIAYDVWSVTEQSTGDFPWREAERAIRSARERIEPEMSARIGWVQRVKESM